MPEQTDVPTEVGAPVEKEQTDDEAAAAMREAERKLAEAGQQPALRHMEREIEIRFTYHPPTPDQIPRYNEIRDNARGLATLIDAHALDSREKSLAMTALEEAVMWANAAIARRS